MWRVRPVGGRQTRRGCGSPWPPMTRCYVGRSRHMGAGCSSTPVTGCVPRSPRRARRAGRNEAARDIRAAQREQANRAADAAERRQEQRHDWQRQVLLDLQDELQRLARVTGRSLLQDAKTVREQGKLFQLPDELGGEESRAATVAVQKLRTRVLDNELRSRIHHFLGFCSDATTGTLLIHKDDPPEELADLITRLQAQLGTDYVALVELCRECPGRDSARSAPTCPAAWSDPARLVGAIGRVCEVHHGCDLSVMNVPAVQVGVDVLGNLVVRPTRPEIVADELRHPDESLLVARRPSEAEALQLSEVPVIDGIGSRNRRASNQGSASHNGNGESGQPAR
jgi:hypothetical protein